MATRGVSDAARPEPAPLPPHTTHRVSCGPRHPRTPPPHCLSNISLSLAEEGDSARRQPTTRRHSRERCVPPPPRTPCSLWRHGGPPSHSKLRCRGCSPRRVVAHNPPARCVTHPYARGTPGDAKCPVAPCVVPAASSAFGAGPLEALARISVIRRRRCGCRRCNRRD